MNPSTLCSLLFIFSSFSRCEFLEDILVFDDSVSGRFGHSELFAQCCPRFDDSRFPAGYNLKFALEWDLWNSFCLGCVALMAGGKLLLALLLFALSIEGGRQILVTW